MAPTVIPASDLASGRRFYYMENVDPAFNVSKFWAIEYLSHPNDPSTRLIGYVQRWGRIGTEGSSKIVPALTSDRNRALDQITNETWGMIESKKTKGYRQEREPRWFPSWWTARPAGSLLTDVLDRLPKVPERREQEPRRPLLMGKPIMFKDELGRSRMGNTLGPYYEDWTYEPYEDRTYPSAARKREVVIETIQIVTGRDLDFEE